eukprot:CAMPEP_0173095756 /NCGR_PEP_ID=MMETSP1102-20130122/32266_1 /TAXON_ID=49646 /ORGANISM="Geminigera sp., Strain Caron Lab Isolate" /LENGTH=401 /DNA_ID=CAMNT_0013986005 /DNA_START=267 /DNA_END=1474 /DNA_ORIENTATION=-
MPGKYRFALTSDDASQLDIDDDIIVSNEIKPLDLAQAAQGEGQLLHAKESIATVWLGKGYHAIRITYFQNSTDNDNDQDPDWPAALNLYSHAICMVSPIRPPLKIDLGGAIGSKPLTLKVFTSNTIEQVKDKLAAQEDIPIEQQTLVLDKDQLAHDITVGEAGLKDGDTLNLIRDESVKRQNTHLRKWSSQVLVLKYAGPDTGSDQNFEVLKGYHELRAGGLGSLKGVILADGSSFDMGDANKYREKNPFHDYDKKWLSKNLDKKWRVYDAADWKEEIGDHVTEIMKPWTEYTKKADAHHHGDVPAAIYSHHPDYDNEVVDEVAKPYGDVPAAIYSHHPDYDNEVVDVSGKAIKWKHKETVPENSVIGSDYASNPEGWDHQWDVSPKSAAFKGNKDGSSGR